MHTRTLAAGLLLAMSSQAHANIDIQFDYSYDTAGFFSSNAGSMTALEAAAAVFETRFADSLWAIDSSGANNFSAVFFNPSDPFGVDISLAKQDFATDVIRVYVGGANLASGTLGLGGAGGYSCSGIATFCADAASRGQGTVSGATATDFALWGGSISFNSAETWHFGTTTTGLDTYEADFYSVAVHELAHVLGFGIADSFSNLVTGGVFHGATTGPVSLYGDEAHWAEGTMSVVNGVPQEAAMDPTVYIGDRKRFTELDYAAMKDIGWDVTPVPEAETWAMMLAGLGLVGFAARRRMS